MIMIHRITEAHGPDSAFVHELVRVFCSARQERLAFLMEMHTQGEDRQFLSKVLQDSQVWVAEVGNKIAGFIAFADGWINHLYIAPAFQRQGTGRRLLNVAKQSSRNLQLWVFEVNEPAILFYKSQGFRIIQRTDGTTNEAKMPDVLMSWNDLCSSSNLIQTP